MAHWRSISRSGELLAALGASQPGQSAALARATKAAELIERLADETTRRLRAFI